MVIGPESGATSIGSNPCVPSFAETTSVPSPRSISGVIEPEETETRWTSPAAVPSVS